MPETFPSLQLDMPTPSPHISITFNHQKAEVCLTIEQTPPQPYLITEQAIYDALSQVGVTQNIFTDQITRLVTLQLYPSQQPVATLPIPSLHVTISPNKLQAYLTINQTPPTPYLITADIIYDALDHAGVEYGILLDEIDQIIAARQYPNLQLIAQGKPAVPPQNAELHYLFVRAGGRPQEKGYRVDYYDLNLVENVIAGQVLVRKIPPVNGVPGITVQGKEIKCSKFRDVTLPVGKGTTISPDNPLELMAAIDGFVRLDRRSFDKVVVEQLYTIDGDIDMAVGNITVEGAIRIKGDVKEGFRVQATGDITITGVVEACYLNAGGNIDIHGGIVGGKNRAIIKAGETITTQFADQADIVAGKTIHLAEEAINCDLQAEETIIVGETASVNGSIVGGLISAGQAIKAVSIGRESGTSTWLQVGERPSLLTRYHAMQAELEAQKEKLAQLETSLTALLEKQAQRLAAREARQSKLLILQHRHAELDQIVTTILTRAQQTHPALAVITTTLQTMQTELEQTRQTLSRVESDIARLVDSIKNNTANQTVETLKTMFTQLGTARQKLIARLNTLESQLARLTDQRDGLSWAHKKELHAAHTARRDIMNQITAIKAENAMDDKLAETIAQIRLGKNAVEQTFTAWQSELETITQIVYNSQIQDAQILVRGMLWQNTSVTILGHKRTFNNPREGVLLKLSADTTGSIVALSLKESSPTPEKEIIPQPF